MSSHEITNSVHSIGILNPNLRVFDIVMKTDYGTTYNSYYVEGTKKKAIIETGHATYFQHYLDNLKSVCDDLASVDYIILNHNEPDHSGVVVRLLELMPNVTLITTQAGSIYIKNITNSPNIKVQVVKDGDTLDLGGKTLSFIVAPFLHWPDTMFTYLAEDKVLFPCDFFGSHYCEPHLFDYNITYPTQYEAALKGYYDAIFGPFKPYVLKGLDKIKDLDIDFVCTSHGPIITKAGRFEYIKEMYTKWSQPHKNERITIPVFYTTAYGNTKLIAESLKEGILSAIPDAQVDLYDIIDHDMTMLQGLLGTSNGFAIGSPTINRDAVPPVWELLSHVDAINCQKKPCFVFGSFGWSGEAVPNIITRLTQLKMDVYESGLKVTFVPSTEDLAKAKEMAAEFAAKII